MTPRWSQFSLGLLAGVVVVLLVLVVLQNREPQAYAAPQGVDQAGGGLIMGVGSSQPNLTDIVWVLWKHPAPKHAPGADTKDDSIIGSKDEFLTLCCYQLEGGARGMRLAAVRNITFDMDMAEYRNAKPSVMEIVQELQKAKPKPPK